MPKELACEVICVQQLLIWNVNGSGLSFGGMICGVTRKSAQAAARMSPLSN